jgi:ParB family chromosome partitioning protein
MTRELGQVEKIFQSFGMSWQSFATNRLPLLNLPEELLQALREGKLAYTKAQAISRIKDEERRQAVLAEAIDKNLSLKEIRKRTKEGNSTQPESLTKEQSLQKRLNRTFNQVKKLKVWEDPKRWKKVEKALVQLEALLEEE